MPLAALNSWVHRAGAAVRTVAALGCCALALLLAGCGGGGELTVRDVVSGEAMLSEDFDAAFYSYDDKNHLNVVLLQGAVDEPKQVLHVRMHWMPVGGSTPIDRRATNATVRYVSFADDTAAVYTGAGFLFPHDDPGGARFSATLRNTSLRLADASASHAEQLGLASATGQFTAELAPERTGGLLSRLQRRLREQLGYPRFVRAGRSP